MPERRSLRSRTSLITQPSPTPEVSMSRPRRLVSGSNKSSITVARAPSRSPDDFKKSIRLTVKMPSSKLRDATSGTGDSITVNSRDAARETFEPGEIVSGPRGTRSKRAIVEDSSSEDDEDEEEEEEEIDEGKADDDDEAEGEQEDGEPSGDDDDENDEEEEPEESEDVDGDVRMEDVSTPPAPIIKTTGTPSKPTLIVTPARNGKVKSVEAKEIQQVGEEEDEELSELSEDAEGDEDEADEEDDQQAPNAEAGEMDISGDGLDSDDETAGAGSRGSTPDVSKMTKRQRSRLDQVMGGDFLQLPMEPQTKKHLTAEEHAMRRVEMARRRKNLSEKRNEEEKMDTINRLLKKQAPKRRGKISAAEIASGEGAATPLQQELEYEKPDPVFVRWISDQKGCRIGVPSEWLSTPVGRVFGGEIGRGRMVEEVVEN